MQYLYIELCPVQYLYKALGEEVQHLDIVQFMVIL